MDVLVWLLPVNTILIPGFSDVKSFFDEDDKNDIYESGPFKGDSKFGVHLGEMIPGTSQAIRLYKTGSKVF